MYMSTKRTWTGN